MEEIDRAIRALKADVERSNVNGGINDAFHNFALYLVLLVRDQIGSYVEDAQFYLRNLPLLPRNRRPSFVKSFVDRRFPCMLPSPGLRSSFLLRFCARSLTT